MAAASSCFSLRAQMRAVPASLNPIGPCAKVVFSRVHMPNSACSLELSYSPCSWNPVLRKGGLFRLSSSSSSTQEGMQLVSSSSSTQDGMQLVSEAEAEAEAEAEKEKEDDDAQETSKSSDDNIPAETKVYLGNLPFSCDSAEVAGVIQEHGSVEMVEVIYDRNSGTSRGFAFATMSSVEDANAVVEKLDGSQYGGRTLRVNLRDKARTEQRNEKKSNNSVEAGQHRVFIGNLSWDVNAEMVSEVFSEYGNLLNANVVYDRETGRSRGFGFITFSTHSEAEAAVASLNGKELEGRSMRVDLALSSRNSE